MQKGKTNNVSDIIVIKKWHEIPKDFQEQVVRNVFCGNCGETTIVDYTMNDWDYGIVLRGKCNHCGKNVARTIESE